MDKNKSWKTTGIAICAFLVALCTAFTAFADGNPETVVNWESLLEAGMAFGVGLGFWAARDNDKTSEDVGAK